MRRIPVAIVFACIATGCAKDPGLVTPPQYQPQGVVAVFDSTDWQTVLTKVVTPQGYVRWDVIQKNSGGVRDALFRYMAIIGTVAPDNRPDLFQTNFDRLAYWINAYNAACMYGVILRNYSSNTQRTVPPLALYQTDKFVFGGAPSTLDDVISKKLRPVGDPRFHFALNNCTRSSPPLRAEPYDALKLNAQLNDQSAHYLSDPRALVRADDTVKLNDIFTKFYMQEFLDAYLKKNNKPGTLVEALRPYAAKHSPLMFVTRFEPMGFDWSLNRPPK